MLAAEFFFILLMLSSMINEVHNALSHTMLNSYLFKK